ncbi:MAG TPA: hypothetical protein VF725_16050 [Ktedonobacterales bacterium]
MAELSSVPFAAGWWSFDLGRYRPCDSTYCLLPYDALPPLAQVDDAFDWLTPRSGRAGDGADPSGNAEEARSQVETLVADAAAHGLTLPASFVRLMSAPDLQGRIPSCTACEFALGDSLVALPGSDGAYAVSFLHDQQDCVVWYLYLAPSGDHCVLSYPGDYELDVDGMQADETEKATEAFRFAAPTFTDFIHRFWLENVLWFKLHSRDHPSLTAEERAYVDHYARQSGQA